MFAIDTSALAAIVFNEPERAAFIHAIRHADKVLVSTATALEARMVVHGRRGERAVVLLDDLLRLPMFELVPLGPREADAAFAAFIAFGKGSGHPANLNDGDLFAYALAKVRGLALLYKGTNLAQTDIGSAVATGAGGAPS